MPLIEVGVLFYAVSLAVAVAVGWFARGLFGCGRPTRGNAGSRRSASRSQ